MGPQPHRPVGQQEEAVIKRHWSWQYELCCRITGARVGHREWTQPLGRMGWDREAECQDPSQASLEFRAGLLSQQENMRLGRRIRLKVSCEDWTNMPRKVKGCEES